MYTVYKRTTPDHKVYIGCTSISVENRAGVGGSRYRNNPAFWAAIKKFGWDAITTEVLAVTADIEQARCLEAYYIAKYKATDPAFGYNRDTTSSFAVTEDTRIKIQARTTDAMTADVRERMSQSIRNSPLFREVVSSEEFKQHCSSAAKKRFSNPAERVRVGEAVKNSAKYQKAISEPGYQERRLARVNSPEAIQKRSDAIKGRVHIHLGSQAKMVPPSEVDKYLALGWERGRAKRNSK